jgi:hypothetical protein
VPDAASSTAPSTRPAPLDPELVAPSPPASSALSKPVLKVLHAVIAATIIGAKRSLIGDQHTLRAAGVETGEG